MKKLTQEVFEGQPERIKSAAIDANGDAWGYSVTKDRLSCNNRRWDDDTSVCDFNLLGFDFDTTDWQNSAIDREV